MSRTPQRRGCGPLCRASLLLLVGMTGCDNGVAGLGGEFSPLARIPVVVTGDLAQHLPAGEALEDVHLRVALVWAGVQEFDDFCIEYGGGVKLPADASAAAVVAAGCRDVFGFVPIRVNEVAVLDEQGRATLDLNYLPTAEVLVGPPEGRGAYAGVVVYDDRDGNQTLDLRRARRHFKPGSESDFGPGKGPPEGGRGPGGGEKQDVIEPVDYVYGGSFISMMQPHVRIAFREGQLAINKYFYPTLGCDPPALGFSTIAVTGTPFKATCVSGLTSGTEVSIPLRATADVAELACENPQTRFRDTEREADLSQPWYCVDNNRLVVANPPGLCKGLTSFLLSGCEGSATCKEPQWDDRDDPPDWWPCGDAAEPSKGGK